MNIFVNNNCQSVKIGSLPELLKHLNLESTKGTALAVNEQVIPKTEWENIHLKEGDRIILIKATQGG